MPASSTNELPAPRSHVVAGEVEEWPTERAWPSTHCVLLVLGDASAESDTALRDFARRALAMGVVYLCAWGPACERVHDAFDDVILERDLRAGVETSGETVIVTTWHADESLEDAIAFFLDCAQPATACAKEPYSLVIACVGRLVATADVDASLHALELDC